jgi:hypothetical protein
MPKRVKLHLRYFADCRQLLHAADDVIDINIIEDLLTKWCLIKKNRLDENSSVFLHQKRIPLIKRSRNHIPWEMELRIT